MRPSVKVLIGAITYFHVFQDGAQQNTGNPLMWDRDLTVPDVCQTYDADPVDEAYFLDPGGRRILSCVPLILDWRSGRNTNPVEYCHVYELGDSSFCNQKQNLCTATGANCGTSQHRF